MFRARSYSLTLVFRLLVIPLAVFGESSVERERVRVSYNVPADCPALSFYEGRVQTRLQGEWLARGGEFARLLRVSVITHGVMWYASLDFEDASGRSVTRTVKGSTCEEAVAAIALVTALAIDSPASESSAAVLATDATGPSATAAPAATEAASGRNASVAGLVSSADSPPEFSSRTTVQRSLTYEIGASYLRTKGIGPGYANGADLFFGLSPDDKTSLARVGFSLFDSGTDPTDLPRVRARVRTVAIRLQSCPLRVALVGPLSLPLCAGFEMGLLHVRGSGDAPELVKGRADQVFWLVPSLSPRLRLDEGAVFVEVGPELRMFLTQRQFSVRYGDRFVQAFETPWTDLGLLATAGLHFQ